MWESGKPASRVCVRAFSGELCEGSSFVHRGAEGGGRSEGEREGGLEEEGSEGYATDRKRRGGGVYLRRNSTPPLGLFPGLGAITFFICAYMSMCVCVCVQARHCACLDVCKPVYLNECRSVLRLTARHEDKSKTRERELKNARKQLAHTAVY